jgi:hypothetical protein
MVQPGRDSQFIDLEQPVKESIAPCCARTSQETIKSRHHSIRRMISSLRIYQAVQHKT